MQLGGLALWHPGGVFLLNCLTSTAVIANEKLKSTLTPAPAPAPTAHKCSLSTLLSKEHPRLTASSPPREEARGLRGGEGVSRWPLASSLLPLPSGSGLLSGQP